MPTGILIVKSASQIFAGCLGLLLSTFACASQFYLFPVSEIEGLANVSSETTRSMIDQRLVKKLFSRTAGENMQRDVIAHFVNTLNQTYPTSVIHPKQVYDINVGSGHKFVNNNQLACKQVPSYNVADTYAVIIGITRASIYEVTKGNNVEVLIPVTLNLQFIKPNLAKIVYTISETMYSPFRFSKAEYESGAVDGVIRDVLLKNIKSQISNLVSSAKVAFNPQDISVNLVDKDGQFFVTDKGLEVGFVKGEQIEARDAADKPSIFDVLYVDSGYAVLKLAAGSASVGDSLKFIIEKVADDSRKPRLMPVISNRSDDAWASSISDIFSKDIGFNASFQLSPVDVNFAQTKELVTRSANCVTWQKIPSIAEASGVRNDPPNFFIRFTPTVTPVTMLSGIGGVKTSELFHTLVTAQVVDQFGKVIFSEIGDNDYSIDKVNGEGLNFAQAREISLKNATQTLAKRVIDNVRFEPRDYKVARVGDDRLWVEGLHGTSLSDKLTFHVLHPLSAKVRGQTAMIDLDVGTGAGGLVADGGLIGLPYSITNPVLPKPQRGDFLRFYTQISSSSTRLQDCSESTYIGQTNFVEVDYLAPLIRHAVYKSKNFVSYIGDPAFYSDTNRLLQQGLFSLQLARPSIELCLQPGYAIREETLQCQDPQNCKATVTMGIVARLKRGSEVQKSFTVGLRSEFTGFPSANKHSLYGYKQLRNSLTMQVDLMNKLNSN
jgi:hypothetical protein